MSIVANRYPKVRAALCHDHFTAQMSREHNDANILVMGERVIGKGVALEIVKTWLETEFAGGRHQLRLNKIARSRRRSSSLSDIYLRIRKIGLPRKRGGTKKTGNRAITCGRAVNLPKKDKACQT